MLCRATAFSESSETALLFRDISLSIEMICGSILIVSSRFGINVNSIKNLRCNVM